MTLVYIGVFGLVGVFARYFLNVFFSDFVASPFPYATLVINVTGSFAIGVAYAFGAERTGLPAEVTTGIMVGLLGGFTTFSAFSLEMSRLIEGGQLLQASAYLGLSAVLGVLATFGGLHLGRLI